jgi:tetratricopeptide (TPR) repeat protein
MGNEALMGVLGIAGTLLLVVVGLLNFSVFRKQLRIAKDQIDTAVRQLEIAQKQPDLYLIQTRWTVRAALTCAIITMVQMGPLQAQVPAPASSAAETQAQQELDQAARAYREGNFVEAQSHSEKALLIDPQNKKAPYFVARTIHAQYKLGDATPENVAKAQEAIVAYKKILDRWPGDDEAYKAVAYLYGALKEDGLLYEWVVQRAADVSLPNDKRAEAFVVLASKEWDCSFKITELPINKVTAVDGKKVLVNYQMPKDRAEFERAKECANRGLEFANMATVLTPENESAWSYKTNILLELEKLAEMSGELQLKLGLHRQYEEALRETTRLSTRPQSKP